MTEPIVFIATCDLAGHVRGRAVPSADRETVLQRGVGWVPADLALTSFGDMAPGHVFGSTGDLRLMPDAATRVTIPTTHGSPGVEILLAEQTLPDGSPWACCPRTFARQALADLRHKTGLSVVASFEHEFMFLDEPATAPFSLARLRAAEPFGTELVELLAAAGLEPENWLPEFGDGQFEITLKPTDALIAADRAILLRELVRDLARKHDRRVTFAPVVDPNGSGNGVHVHLSLKNDATGDPTMLDDSRPGRLSEQAARFAAGILTHAQALCAVTAPSATSFLRLVPSRWSAGGVFLAERNREALLRICPTSTVGGGSPHKQFNLEYRASDATANPWLVLGVLVRAGLRAIEDSYDLPEVWPENVADVSLLQVPALPSGLDEALDALEADKEVSSWFDHDLLDTHIRVKRAELAATEGLSAAEVCQLVASVY